MYFSLFLIWIKTEKRVRDWEDLHSSSGGELQGKKPLEKPKRRLENTEIDFKMAEVDWIYMARIMTSGGLLWTLQWNFG